VAEQAATNALRVAMALYGDVTFDSRVIREADSLSRAGHDVTVYCLSGSPPAGAPFRVVTVTPEPSAVLPDGSSPFLKEPGRRGLRAIAARIRWMLGYGRTLRAWGRRVARTAGAVDVWHLHDLTGLLAVGPLVGRRAGLIYDSHEIFIETGSIARLPRPIRQLIGAYEGQLARRAAAVVTVNEGCASVLERRLHPRRMVIVRNCPPRWSSSSGQSTTLRRMAGLPGDVPMLLYHGAFVASRGIEQLAEAVLEPGLEHARLVLLGYGPSADMVRKLAGDPRFGGRLHVVDAALPSELLEWISGADVDVIPIQRSTLNHWLGTPNRLWESLAAGVPVVASDFPIMRRVVMDGPSGQLGAMCRPEEPASIAGAIRSILELPLDERAALRARCLAAAHERWNWETEVARLLDLYRETAVA
jgi:glycosyltransferase involved in cell wall biosynthesis